MAQPRRPRTTSRHLHAVPASTEQHPHWCNSIGLGLAACGTHFGEWTVAPATAGGYSITDDSLAYPFAEVAAGLDEDGIAGVHLTIKTPLTNTFPRTGDWVGAVLDVNTADRIVSAIFTAVAGEQGGTFTGASFNGPVTVTIAPTAGDVAVSLSRDGDIITATMRASEAAALAAGVEGAVKSLTGSVVASVAA